MHQVGVGQLGAPQFWENPAARPAPTERSPWAVREEEAESTG